MFGNVHLAVPSLHFTARRLAFFGIEGAAKEEATKR